MGGEEEGLRFTVEDAPDPAEVRALVASLVAANGARAEPEGHRPLAAFVRRGSDEVVVGGASGYTHWGWLFVGHLWVAEEARRRGAGHRLVATMEDAARRRGCRAAHLDTYSFQALPFYLHLGYRPFGELADYPAGHTRHFLWKPLG